MALRWLEDMTNVEPLPTCLVTEIQPPTEEGRWLIQSLWGKSSVGFLGAPPKSKKSWLAVEMAISIASGRDCLDKFPVLNPGRVLIYVAEGSLPDLRGRIEAICAYRQIAIDTLELKIITSSWLRLDVLEDQKRMAQTIATHQAVFVVLDPFVRLHSQDENNAQAISGLLNYFRELQRIYDVAIMIVHHTVKSRRSHLLGQSLRGSGDIHAFGDSNAYIVDGKKDRLWLHPEHRFARAHAPIPFRLIETENDAKNHLEIVSLDEDAGRDAAPAATLSQSLIDLLSTTEPLPKVKLRSALKVNNQRLGKVIEAMERQGRIVKTQRGWTVPQPLAPPQPPTQDPADRSQLPLF